jgi:hypothetical protein
MSFLVGNIFGDVINQLTNQLINIINSIKAVIQFLFETATNLVKQGIDFIDNELTKLGVMTPEKAREHIAGLIVKGFSLVVGVYIISQAMDAIPFIRGSTILEMGTFLQRLFGIEAMVGAFTGAVLGTAFSKPLQLYANEKFRPNEYDVATAFRLWAKGILSAERLHDVLARNGFDEQRIKELVIDFPPHFSTLELARLHDILDLPTDFIVRQLMNSGWRGKELDLQLQGVLQRSLKDELNRFAGSVLQMFREGLIDVPRFEFLLGFAGLTKDEVTLTKNNAGIEFERELIREKITIIRNAFRRGFLTQGELKQFLELLKLRPEKINNIWIDELIRADIRPNELLTFPQITFFMPTALTMTFTTIRLP